jgi:hypothetical protein
MYSVVQEAGFTKLVKGANLESAYEDFDSFVDVVVDFSVWDSGNVRWQR